MKEGDEAEGFAQTNRIVNLVEGPARTLFNSGQSACDTE